MSRLSVEPHTGWVLRHPSKFGTITIRARKDGTRSYRQKGGNQSAVDADGVYKESAVVEFARGWLAARIGRSAIVEATTLEPVMPDEPKIL